MTATAHQNLTMLTATTLILVFLAFSVDVTKGVQTGLNICYRTIIPSVFPFCVLSSCLAFAPPPPALKNIKQNLFARLFHLPPCAAFPYLIGLLCGFPLGTKSIADGYRNGLYTREQAERMLCFCNNTGVSFLITGIGGSLHGNYRIGLALLIIQILLSLFSALLLALWAPTVDTHEKPRASITSHPFSLSQAISSAALSTLSVCSFVIFFSVILTLLSLFMPAPAYLFVAALLEVGNACSSAVRSPLWGYITGFSVCFSGISVHLQCANMLHGTDLSMRKYLIVKPICGLLGGALMSLHLFFFS